jgi:hypothetical protein
MFLAPPVGGLLLDLHWLVAWTFVPAVTAALGLIMALIVRRATPIGELGRGPAATPHAPAAAASEGASGPAT